MKVSLQCAIVGQTGSSFDVEIDDCEKVSKLKKAIKKDQKFDFAARKLQLFLAKVPKEKQDEVERTEEVKDEVQEDMTWLYSRSEDVKKLKEGEKTRLIEALTMERHELQGEDPLEDVLNGIDPPSVRQIHVLVVVPKVEDVERSTVANTPIGPSVNTRSCDELLAFLEGEMTDTEKILSNPHILDSSGLQFRFTGRQGAIETAADCFRQIIKASRTTGSDPTHRPIPVCSGISGLGKTRMLEEGVTILKRLKLDPKQIVPVLVPYSNGFNPTPVERSMPIVASFSWRLLYRFFLDKNCAVPFEKWFTSRLPFNGDELLLSDAIEVIERKLRQRMQGQESLYLFLGIDEYQKIEEVGATPTHPKKNPHTTIVRELVNAIGDLLCSQSSGLVVLPMFAGTDLGIIASGLITNSSCYVTKRLPMTLLMLSEVVTSVESNAEFAGFLRDNHIRRHLFVLGGVPRWVVEFLLRLKKCTQPDDSSEPRGLSVESIDNCFNEVWATCVAFYANSIDFHRLVRLAAFAVSNQQVQEFAPFDDGWKWSQLRDSALCLLKPSGLCALDVQVPYALLLYIADSSTLGKEFRTDEERAFAMSLLDMKKLVDKNLFDLEPWQLWEKFGACFYAMRINALLVLGLSTVTLGELLRGAQMTSATSEISVELALSRVFQCEEPFGHSTPQFVSRQGHLSEKIDWTSSGNIIVNGANGAGVDIFFALKDARSGNLIVFVDQRKRVRSHFQPKEYLDKLRECRPAFLGEDTRLVGGVVNCVAPSNLETDAVPHDCFLLTRNETFHGTLAYHPACSPFVPINSANKTALLSVLSGSKEDKDEAAKEIMRKRLEPSGGFTDYEAMRSRFKAMKLEVEIDCYHAVWTR